MLVFGGMASGEKWRDMVSGGSLCGSKKSYIKRAHVGYDFER